MADKLIEQEAIITAADRSAAEKQARKHYQTAYDYEMDLQKAFAEHRNRATTIYDYDPCSVTQNKAGGLWYRRWFKVNQEIADLTADNERLKLALTRIISLDVSYSNTKIATEALKGNPANGR